MSLAKESSAKAIENYGIGYKERKSRGRMKRNKCAYPECNNESMEGSIYCEGHSEIIDGVEWE